MFYPPHDVSGNEPLGSSVPQLHRRPRTARRRPKSSHEMKALAVSRESHQSRRNTTDANQPVAIAIIAVASP